MFKKVSTVKKCESCKAITQVAYKILEIIPHNFEWNLFPNSPTIKIVIESKKELIILPGNLKFFISSIPKEKNSRIYNGKVP